jgi:hypothetical protein
MNTKDLRLFSEQRVNQMGWQQKWLAASPRIQPKWVQAERIDLMTGTSKRN